MPITSVTSTQSGLVAASGVTLDVVSGGVLVSGVILSGGSATVLSGGIDSGSIISAGGAELLLGSANADIIAGVQTVSTAAGTNGLVTNETVVSGGTLFLSIKNTSAANTVISSGGIVSVNGSIYTTNNIVFGGGTLDLASAQARAAGSLVFSGTGGDFEITGNTAAGSGDLAVISGFGPGDIIDITNATSVGAAGSAVTSSVSVVSGNTQIVVSGATGSIPMSFTFSGTTIGADLVLQSDGAGGEEIVYIAPASGNITVSSGVTSTGLTVGSGATVTVLSGGTISNTSVLSGGSATVQSGGTASGTTVASGGTETVAGTASGGSVSGTVTISGATATATGETVQSGGVLAVASGTVSGTTVASGGTLNLSGTATDTTIAGGTVNLNTAQATISGGLTFNGAGTLDIAVASATGAGDQAVISGFYAGDIVNLPTFGSGATLSTTTSAGNTVATVTSGGATETLVFAGSGTAANLSLTSNGTGGEEIKYAGAATTTAYTPGDLVLSIYGDGAGTGNYTLDQAAPITLEEITQSGAIVSQQVLPQTTTVVNGVTQYAISGEYQSASEGLLTLAANGQSLTIMGYGVTATAFDAANAMQVYGTTALGQSQSVPSSTITTVPRIVADISYNAKVDTSTELYGVFNTNNPRSVYTVNGTTFYISGQGNGADGTEGVFVANDGSTYATPIYNTKTDTRDIEIQNGQLYVSVDSKLNGGGSLDYFGATLPTSATTPTALPGIGSIITLTSGTGNTVNSGSVGSSVQLSPEQYFFANPTTLYIADGGVPKLGGVGDGGLQKWSLVSGTWVLDYTLSQGLNLVPSSATTGTTGLVGLTGTVEGNNVILYASNETAAETDQTYLHAITDTLAATTAPTGESFTLLETAAPDTLIRGVSFAPTSAATTPQISTTVSVGAGVTSTGQTVASGGFISVASGGTISSFAFLSGASATIAEGGTESATFLGHGATELVLGSATGDYIDGIQTVSNNTALVTSETIDNGGTVDLFLTSAILSGATILSGGQLNISGHAYGDNLVISGGLVKLQSPKAVLSGSIAFVGQGGTIEVTSATSAGYGDLGVISGFAATDVVDERAMGAGSVLSTSVVGSNTLATITSGSEVTSFTFAGTYYTSGLALTSDGFGGVDLTYTPPPPVVITVSSGVTSSGLTLTSGSTISVLSGGVMSAIGIQSGGSAVVASGGLDSGSTISAGGFELVSGSVVGDQVYGIQELSAANLPANASNETVFNGGTIEVFLKPDTITNVIVSSGGDLFLSGNVSATNVTLMGGATLALQSPKAEVSGTLTFSGAATETITAVTSAPFGNLETISGFGAGDIIDDTFVTSATLGTTVSGGNTVVTITPTLADPTGSSLSFIFAGTTIGANISLVSDGGTGVELTYVPCFREGTKIGTTAGEIAVEDLRVGDLALTAGGQAKPITWIGQRTLTCARHPRPQSIWPVLVQANAFGPAQPSRDLYLSPDHAVFVDGVLIPVGELLNGDTIRQITVDSVSYYHVELALHDVILAEGLPVESFLDTGNRAGFVNGGAALTLHPDFAAPNFAAHAWATACADLVIHGPILDTVRTRLASRRSLAA